MTTTTTFLFCIHVTIIHVIRTHQVGHAVVGRPLETIQGRSVPRGVAWTMNNIRVRINMGMGVAVTE